MVLLFVGQLATGTDVRFAVGISLFIILFAAAFNQAGGLYYPSGAFIFFNGVLTLLLGVTYKVFLLERGESHLLSPYLSIMVYCGGMASMWGAVAISKRFTPRRGLLTSFVNKDTMMQSAIGCFVLGSFFILAFGSVQQKGGSLGAAISETNRFPQFAIMLATTYELRISNGRRAWNWLVITQSLILFALGVIYTSKEGMFTGPITWLITVVAARFNFKPKLLIGGALFAFFMVYYMVPYSQYVRVFRDKTNSRVANQTTTLDYIFRLNEVRALYLDSEEKSDYDKLPHLYDKSQGLMDRLCALGMDDSIIARTEDGFVFGLYPTYHGIVNTIPTFLWHDKPFFFTGNEYGRELGVLAADDFTTGVSFSISADGFHEAKWLGLFVVLPLICFAYFLANDSFVGSAKDSPWPLLLIILASHMGPESALDGLLLQVAEGSIGILFMALVIRYLLPLAVRVMTGGERTVVRRTRDFRLGAQPLGRPGDGADAGQR